MIEAGVEFPDGATIDWGTSPMFFKKMAAIQNRKYELKLEPSDQI